MRFSIRLLCFALTLACLSVSLLSACGCTSFYEAVGMSPTEVTTQAAKDTEQVTKFVEQSREDFWKIANATVSGVFAIIATYLGISLKKEKGITKTVITGVELSESEKAKNSIFLTSKLVGNVKEVQARVSTLTDNAAIGETKAESEKVE